ncbi:MAG: Hsp70 family protein, partial [Candidatus Cloacimonetes bacterium]|nr:Hsp70 family protein [Candidatus Cloacimonadota bacterium]
GERSMAGDNKSLGRFDLVGIPSAPRGIPQIEVTFDIDANGILHVSAKDKGTGKEQSIHIDRAGDMSKDDIDRMIKEAEMHAEEDKKRQEFISAKNELDSLIFGTEKSLRDYGDKLSESEKSDLEAELKSAKEQMEKATEASELETVKQNLAQKAQRLGEIIYSQAQQDQAAEGGPAEGQPGPQPEEPQQPEGPIDADFEVVDDK